LSCVLKPEEEARQLIDDLLSKAGWAVQNYRNLNLGASLGVAVTEFPTNTGPADYILFVDRKAVGVVEAKPIGTTLSGVAEQSQGYMSDLAANVPHIQLPLPFGYESTVKETYFRDIRDPDVRSRRVFAFHTPETLADWISEPNTLRARLRSMPALTRDDLRDCQFEAITNLEESFSESRPRALIQMASGSGKTYTAVSFVYRLIKYANAKRILFLVDRSNLGRQTKREFEQYITPDDGRKFTELYNLQHLTSNAIDPVSRVCITTIQRLYSMLKGDKEFDPEAEETSLFDIAPSNGKPKDVGYNPDMPIDTFDFIITDECHRSIYNLWRQVLEYFDGFIIGLTATPSKQTIGFFDKNLVMEYNHERAVADGVNVGYEVYRIKTEITEKGSKVDAKFWVGKRNRKTRETLWEQLDEDLQYDPTQLDRSVVAPDQIRTIIRTFKDRLFTELFPGRTEVPKTLIFAKDDSHAEDIVHIVREEFGKGNDFCKKITYRTTGEKPEVLIQSFRNSYYPRIAVTVDMIATGTDIRPLECLIFMRDVKSQLYFDQMKGRGSRVIDETDFRQVTNDARNKTHFIIIDAVGVCESDKTDTRPLERKHSVPFEKLVQSVAVGIRDEDTISSLAGRLAKMDREIGQEDRREIQKASGGKSIRDIVNLLIDSIDPDMQLNSARKASGTEEPTDKQLKESAEKLVARACLPFDNPNFRDVIVEVKKRNEQVIDKVSEDKVVFAGFDEKAKEKAKNTIDTFRKFIEENRNEIDALQIIYGKPYGQRQLTYEMIEELASAIKKPPYRLTEERIWNAYEQLEKSKVRGAGPARLMTDLIALVRYAVGMSEVLEPFTEMVEERFKAWISKQEEQGREFKPEEMTWLRMIKDHIATSAVISMDDFDNIPFSDKGGRVKAYRIFGAKLEPTIAELNTELVG
jgi:type I restriction enzyme, R subunit